ncbi:hypothetical protein BpJC7_17320 [Weizmannia acidilactici]|uniref:Uncharacterized protein n=1 Tax=Weizmannia acidilactici TaxID=2607726 RepID=A0A5J4JG72_9BACI|nr:hypothetical protein [Weizmannia acidilactici]GER65560.1 hypothetical protein BpJC4_00310 [Weizmannia acidilactici]GER70429.1 hypothetical protein BpJC7_17320 [Weizmannia acidilactici]GER74100.1 hypothetical protein BpPP18_21670 [Weizmannia acidilactici]
MYKLVKPVLKMKEEYKKYLQEWENRGERIVPSKSKLGGRSCEDFIRNLRSQETDAMYRWRFVLATLYVLADENNKIYDARDQA